jgi:hypothetical protein
MRSIAIASLAALLFLPAGPVVAGDDHNAGARSTEAAAVEKCEHGVKKTVCTRCNPKLEPVFKSKGDWCPEHALPESQCVKCNPDLAKQGVK